MSTPSSAFSVPFSISSTLTPYKLFELPPDLVTLLESPNPPTLHLTTGTSTPHALLTTPTGTYRLQQKNTSNPLMLLKPSITAASEDLDDDMPRASMCAVAKIEDTIELLPYDPAIEAASTAPAKVNKWHEKFAASRAAKK